MMECIIPVTNISWKVLVSKMAGKVAAMATAVAVAAAVCDAVACNAAAAAASRWHNNGSANTYEIHRVVTIRSNMK